MRKDYRVRTDGLGVVRYFIDGTQVDPDFYVAAFFQDYGAVPTDPLIALTPRQEVDNAGQTFEDPASRTNVFNDVSAWDAAHPAPAAVPTKPDGQLN